MESSAPTGKDLTELHHGREKTPTTQRHQMDRSWTIHRAPSTYGSTTNKATFFIFQFTLVNFSYTPQFSNLPQLIFATILFKPKAQVFFFRELLFYECMVYYNKRSLFRYDQYVFLQNIIKSLRWTSSFQEDELLLVHKVDEFISKSLKWTSSFQEDGLLLVHKVDESLMWTSSFQEDDLLLVHKLDKFISRSIKWMSSSQEGELVVFPQVDEFIL